MHGENQSEEQYEEIVLIFDSNEGSPYSKRRHPVYRDEAALRTDFDWTTPSVVSDYDTDNNATDTDMQDSVFPFELQSQQSMQSLRNRRNPHYQGTRCRKSRRVIDKNGERNIDFLHIPERSRRFFQDFVTTIIEERWRHVITVFVLSFVMCWIFFAIFWYLISYAHGDLTIDAKSGHRLNDGSMPCVEGATTFTGFLLFSIETQVSLQVSIGYGAKYPNEECPEAIFLLVAQIVMGIAIEGAMVGIVYVKMVRPPKKSSDMKFSRKAVVCQRDSKLCLLFRVCDANEIHVVESKVHAYLLEERISLEGEILHQFQHPLKLENDGRVFVIFPITVCHVIDNTSPLYDYSAKDLLQKRFEIVLTLTGASRSTGQMSEERTSYLPKEILWGHRFVNIIEYDLENGVYVTDYDHFDTTQAVDIPLCSAKRLDEVIEEVQNYFENSPRSVFSENENDVESNESIIKSKNHLASTPNDFVKEVRFRLSQLSLNQKKIDEESNV